MKKTLFVLLITPLLVSFNIMAQNTGIGTLKIATLEERTIKLEAALASITAK